MTEYEEKFILDNENKQTNNTESKHTEKCTNCGYLFKPENINVHRNYCKQKSFVKNNI